MINSFLVTLYNNATQPTNPLSEVGDIAWPQTYLPRTYTPAEQEALAILFGPYAAVGLPRFLAAIQLLFVVQESVCADLITVDDRRITYTQAQLAGQFNGVLVGTYDPKHISNVMKNAQFINTSFLTGRLLGVNTSSLCATDRLSAVIAHLGLR